MSSDQRKEGGRESKLSENKKEGRQVKITALREHLILWEVNYSINPIKIKQIQGEMLKEGKLSL